jgi:hypothetical protein
MKNEHHIRVMDWFVMLAIVVLVYGCASDSSTQTGIATGTVSMQNESVSTAEVTRYSVGDTFVVNNLSWTVVGFEQLAEIKSLFSDTQPHQPSNGTWLVVLLDFRGNAGMAGGFDTAALKIRDASGRLYDIAEPSGAADDYRLTHTGVKNLSLAMLDDTQVQHVFAIYDVSDTSDPYTLEWMGVRNGSLTTIAKVGLSQ